MPTSITIVDSKDDDLTTIFFTKAVHNYLQENSDFLPEGKSWSASELEEKYDELRKVDEEALKFANLEALKDLDPEFLSAYEEVKELYQKDKRKFAIKLLKGVSSKYCLKIAGAESPDLLKLDDKEKLHVFVLEDLYDLWDNEKATVRAAKEFLRKSSEPYTIAQIFAY